jgi:hypothetical protein
VLNNYDQTGFRAIYFNRYSLQANNIAGWGWGKLASNWTTDEMAAQLMRLKYVAEELHYLSGLP